MLKINHDKCTICKLCVKNCPFGALSFQGDTLVCGDTCTLCGACVNVCRFDALRIERKQPSAAELAGYRDVFVWIELESQTGHPTPRKVALELLGKGRILADALQQQLVAVVVGAEMSPEIAELGRFGADRVIFCGHELLQDYSTDGYTHAICAVITSKKPAVFLYGATPRGRDLAPRVAARLRLGLTADCTGLAIDDQGQLVQTRPAFGGNIMASIITPCSRPQTATVRPNVFPVPKPDPARKAAVEQFAIKLTRAAICTRVVERDEIDSGAEMKIEDAAVLVSGGRGMQKAANMDLLRAVAKILGGTVSGSRAIVEQGWIPHTLQVGQSGTTVGPELYLAAGISGAIQHIVGMSSAKKVIAINKDENAPIFKSADLAVVGDASQILEALLRLLSSPKI